jgi:hypothetical protein
MLIAISLLPDLFRTRRRSNKRWWPLRVDGAALFLLYLVYLRLCGLTGSPTISRLNKPIFSLIAVYLFGHRLLPRPTCANSDTTAIGCRERTWHGGGTAA